MQNVIRYIIIALIVIVLVIISIGIVKFVPKAMSGLANATVSFGSIFGADDEPKNNYVPTPATTTPATSTPKTNNNSNDDFLISDIIPPKKSTNTSRPRTPTYNYPVTGGTPDLAVTILSSSGTYSSNDVVRVNFRVDNRGTGATGPWSLRVNMPSTNPANTQKVFSGLNSLPAGSAITGQAVFDQPAVGTQQISIMADYLGLIAELNESNNTAVSNIQVSQVGNNNGNNNPGNISCPSGYYLTIVNGQYTCYPNNNNNQANCPIGYYPQYRSDGTYQCVSNNNNRTGGADLQVRVLEFGTIDPYTNQFYSNGNLACNQSYPSTDCTTGAYIRTGQRAAVRFQIYNAGGTPSGQFYFRTEMNPSSSQNRTSGPEASLIPGATNTYTVGYDVATIGQHTIILYADSQSSVNETNESNNVMRVNFTVSPYVQY